MTDKERAVIEAAREFIKKCSPTNMHIQDIKGAIQSLEAEQFETECKWLMSDQEGVHVAIDRPEWVDSMGHYATDEYYCEIANPPSFIKPGQLWERTSQSFAKDNAWIFSFKDGKLRSYNGYWWQLVEDHSENEVMDCDKIMWEGIQRAAEESTWMPKEYCMNDWVSEVQDFLRNGPKQTEGAWITDRRPTEDDAFEDMVYYYDNRVSLNLEMWDVVAHTNIPWQPVPQVLRTPPVEQKCEDCVHYRLTTVDGCERDMCAMDYVSPCKYGMERCNYEKFTGKY